MVGVERAAVEAQEVQQQHAQIRLQAGAAAARGVRQQERRHHDQQRVGAHAALVHLRGSRPAPGARQAVRAASWNPQRKSISKGIRLGENRVNAKREELMARSGQRRAQRNGIPLPPRQEALLHSGGSRSRGR